METHTFFLHLVVILVAARVMAEATQRLGLPPVIGELMAGVILGPSLLGLIEPNAIIRILAEIGIILLLFQVGLETDLHRLLRSGGDSLLVASGGVVLPFVFGVGLAWGFLGLDLLPALFVGGTLTATSIGITVRVLTDLGRHNSHEGQVVLGAAVLDDIFGVVLLALLYDFSTAGGVSVAAAGRVVVFIGIFFLLATPVAKLMSGLISRFNEGHHLPGLIPTSILSLVLFFAWLSHAVGAPELLGGFAAGLALSRRFFLPFGLAIRTSPGFARRVESQMKPIVQLFTPVFFVMVGLSLDLRNIDWGSSYIWLFSLSLFVVAVAGKVLAAFLIRDSWYSSWAIGLAMVPRGEVGLIFAELGRAGGILDNRVHAGMVIVIALTTLLLPLVLKAFYARYGARLVEEDAGRPELPPNFP